MKKYLKLILFFVFSGYLISCAKELPEELPGNRDTIVPEIVYMESLNSLYRRGANVKFNVKVTDNEQLEMVSLKLVNTTIDSVYLDIIRTTTEKEIIISDSVETHLNTVMADFDVLIIARDVSGNEALSKRSFHVMN